MCLVIHKPRDARIPDELLVSAAKFNPDGFGILSFGATRGIDLRRRSQTRTSELLRLYRERQSFECVVHLRYRTRGAIVLGNTQPLHIANDIYMVHNGTVDLDLHTRSFRYVASDRRLSAADLAAPSRVDP
jgi:predicted glutamine amidotransferase